MCEYDSVDRNTDTFIYSKSSRWIYISGEVNKGRHTYDIDSVYFMSFNNQFHVQFVTESFAKDA